MSKVKFTPEQLEILRNNQYTAHVTENTLFLTKEFKEIFYREYLSGSIPRDILQKYGYPVEILGKERIWGISHIIKKEYETKGSFSDIRSASSKSASGSQSTEDQLRKMQNEIDYLTQEVEFLKKISSIRNTRK